EAQCSVNPDDRITCGYPGIGSEKCRSKGCCFDPSIPGDGWCFFSKYYNEAQCSVNPDDRINCGYKGISFEKCRSKGCCFDPSIPDCTCCFFSKNYSKGYSYG
ncbi:hypothetical protein AB205_0029540, partial [Aquarana catesbeiana]